MLFMPFVIRYVKKDKHVIPNKSKGSCCVCTVTSYVFAEDGKVIFHFLSRDTAMLKTCLFKTRKQAGLYGLLPNLQENARAPYRC